MEHAACIKKKKLFALDAVRIAAALFVFLFHSNLLVDYGALEPFVSVSAIFMDAFFCLSGFLLYYGYADKTLSSANEIFSFYRRRFVKLYPAYFCVMAAWFVIHTVLQNDYPLHKNLLIAPVEFLLLQSFFPRSEFVAHNTGTWFVSVIFFCYFLFPLIKKLVSQLSLKKTIVLMLPLYCLCSGMPFFSYAFGIDSMYFNPFFRTLEFSIGILLYRCLLLSNLKISNIKIYFMMPISIFILFISVSAYVINGLPNLWYLQFCFLTLPIFSLQIFLLSCLNNDKVDAFFQKRPIKFLTSLTYEFFLAQHFCFDLAKQFLTLLSKNMYGGGQNNCIVFLLSFLSCLVISVLIHFVSEFIKISVEFVVFARQGLKQGLRND